MNKKVQGAKINGNNKYYKYLSNLIPIEHQQQIHRVLNITLINAKLVASNSLKAPSITPYLGTVFPSPSMKTSGETLIPLKILNGFSSPGIALTSHKLKASHSPLIFYKIY